MKQKELTKTLWLFQFEKNLWSLVAMVFHFFLLALWVPLFEHGKERHDINQQDLKIIDLYMVKSE